MHNLSTKRVKNIFNDTTTIIIDLESFLDEIKEIVSEPDDPLLKSTIDNKYVSDNDDCEFPR